MNGSPERDPEVNNGLTIQVLGILRTQQPEDYLNRLQSMSHEDLSRLIGAVFKEIAEARDFTLQGSKALHQLRSDLVKTWHFEQ